MNVLFSFHNTDTNHPTFTMKALSSPDGSPRPRTSRRPSKPLMEKRRRERINHSLETIRLLMLDNTNDEKLKNPKVEKAEILESVVHFLMEDKAVNRMAVSPRAQRPTRGRQHSYQDGMRSCLMRVSHYIASNRQTDQASVTSNEPHTHSTPASPSPGHVHGAMMPATPGNLAAGHGTPPHPYLSQTPADLHGDSSNLLSPSAALMNLNDPVWRPWPQ